MNPGVKNIREIEKRLIKYRSCAGAKILAWLGTLLVCLSVVIIIIFSRANPFIRMTDAFFGRETDIPGGAFFIYVIIIGIVMLLASAVIWIIYKQRYKNIKQIISGNNTNKSEVEKNIRESLSKNNEDTMTILQVLSDLGSEYIIELAVPYLRDTKREVRRESALILQKKGWKPDSTEEQVYFSIAKGDFNQVAKYGEAAIDPLLTYLNDKDENIRVEVLQALANTGSERALKYVSDLTEDKNDNMRRTAQLIINRVNKSKHKKQTK